MPSHQDRCTLSSLKKQTNVSHPANSHNSHHNKRSHSNPTNSEHNAFNSHHNNNNRNNTDNAESIITLSALSLRCIVSSSCQYCRNLINDLNNNSIRFGIIDINSYQFSSLPEQVKSLAQKGVPCILGVVDPQKNLFSCVNGYSNLKSLSTQLSDSTNYIVINPTQNSPPQAPQSVAAGLIRYFHDQVN